MTRIGLDHILKLEMVIVLVLVFGSATLLAQPSVEMNYTPDSRTSFIGKLLRKQTSDLDTLYVADYSNQLNLALYSKVKYADFKVRDELTDEELKYSPNRQINLGLYYHYRRLGLGLAFGVGFLNVDDAVKGNTTRLDWQGNIYGRKYVIDLSFMNYKSYYLTNTKHIINDWQKGDDNYIRPDIRMFNMGGSAIYILNNKRFSYRAAFLQTDIQKKSAGSVLGGALFNFNFLRADSSLFPSQSVFQDYPSVPLFNNFAFGLRVGYAYNYIFKEHYFASLALSPSLLFGIEYAVADGADITRARVNVGLQPRFALGYNSKLWYYGLSVVEDVYLMGDNLVKEGVSLRYSYGNIKFFVGRRIPSFDLDKYKNR
jgi:hypothetical protein